MMDKYDFRGAWISPDGKAHWTSAMLSHMKAIRELGLEQQLRETRAKVQWTSEEDAMHRKEDLPYVALKAGYIRILAFSD